MPVPSSISDLSSTASSNYPSGSESIGTSLDDYLRAHASIIKQVSDAKADSSSLTSHTGASAAHGVTGSVVGTTDTQTLQNKTLDGTNKFSRSAQIGSSGTATNNFSIEVPASPDGSMKLARGNAGATTQDVMTVDSSGKVAFPQNVQSWQNMTSIRAIGSTYTNSTGQPITVNVNCTSSTAAGLTVTVGGSVIAQSNGQVTVGYAISIIGLVIPNGATYKLDITAGTPANLSWWELR